MVERLEANRESELTHQTSERRAALMRQVRESEDMLYALAEPQLNVASLMTCDGAAVMMGGLVQSIGGDFASLAMAVVARLEDRDDDECATDRWQHDGPNSDDARYCGVVAIRFHRANAGWILWFRLEEVHKIRWGGKPEKTTAIGPSGTRLTPRGSFDAWEEVVRGTSAPWTSAELDTAASCVLTWSRFASTAPARSIACDSVWSPRSDMTYALLCSRYPWPPRCFLMTAGAPVSCVSTSITQAAAWSA